MEYNLAGYEWDRFRRGLSQKRRQALRALEKLMQGPSFLSKIGRRLFRTVKAFKSKTR